MHTAPMQVPAVTEVQTTQAPWATPTAVAKEPSRELSTVEPKGKSKADKPLSGRDKRRWEYWARRQEQERQRREDDRFAWKEALLLKQRSLSFLEAFAQMDSSTRADTLRAMELSIPCSTSTSVTPTVPGDNNRRKTSSKMHPHSKKGKKERE